MPHNGENGALQHFVCIRSDENALMNYLKWFTMGPTFVWLILSSRKFLNWKFNSFETENIYHRHSIESDAVRRPNSFVYYYLSRFISTPNIIMGSKMVMKTTDLNIKNKQNNN